MRSSSVISRGGQSSRSLSRANSTSSPSPQFRWQMAGRLGVRWRDRPLRPRPSQAKTDCPKVEVREEQTLLELGLRAQHDVACCRSRCPPARPRRCDYPQAKGTPQRTFPRIQDIAVSPNGTLLAVAHDDYGENGQISLYSLETLQLVVRFHAKKYENPHTLFRFRNLAFTPSSDAVVSSDRSGRILSWKVPLAFRDRQLRLTAASDSGRVRQLQFTQSGDLLLSGTNTGQVHMWDAEKGQHLHSLDAHDGFLWAMTVAPSDRFFATGGRDRQAKIWSLKQAEPRLVQDDSGSQRRDGLGLQPGRITVGHRSLQGQDRPLGRPQKEGDSRTRRAQGANLRSGLPT